MDFTRKLSFLVFVLCVLISLKKQKAEPNRNRSFQEGEHRDYAVRQQLNENAARSRLDFHDFFVEAGGPYYHPLFAGSHSYYNAAAYELPSPQDDLSWTIESFASRAFDATEADSLMGTIHSKFFLNHNYNSKVTYKPYPSFDLPRSRCNLSRPSSPSSTENNISLNCNW